jgi:hypothetical protein
VARVAGGVVIRVGDRIMVTNPADEYCGQEGTVIREEYLGLASGRPIVEAQLDGRARWDVEGFYVDHVLLEQDAQVAA